MVAENITITLNSLPWPSSGTPDAVWQSHYFPLCSCSRTPMTAYISLYFSSSILHWWPRLLLHWETLSTEKTTFRFLPQVPIYPAFPPAIQRNYPWSYLSSHFLHGTLDLGLSYLCKGTVLAIFFSFYIIRLSFSRSFLSPCKLAVTSPTMKKKREKFSLDLLHSPAITAPLLGCLLQQNTPSPILSSHSLLNSLSYTSVPPTST